MFNFVVVLQDLVCLTTYYWQPCILKCVTSKQDDLAKFLAMFNFNMFKIIEYHLAYFARNFANSSFSNVTKSRKIGLSMVRSQTD